MKHNDQFSADMSKIFSLVQDECGGNDIQEAIFDCFDGDIDISSENEADWVESYQYSDRGMLHVLYAIVNYDLISLYSKVINVEESNHPDIAALIKPYVKQDTINKVHELLYE